MNRQRLWVLIGGLAWLIFFAITISFPASPHPALIPQIASILIGMTMLFAILLSAQRPFWPAYMRWAIFAAGVLFVLVPYLMNANAPGVKAFVALGLIMVALPVGYWVGDRMEKVTNLIPLAIGMSLADVFSVSQGLSRRVAREVVEHQQEVAEVMGQATSTESMAAAVQTAAQLKAPLGNFIIVHMPIAGTGMSSPVLGIGDFIIMAFFFRAAWVHRIPPASVFWPGLISVVVALGLSQWLGIAIPALPFIALGCVGWLWLTHPRIRNLDRQEILLSVAVVAIFAALIGYRFIAGLLGQ